MVNDYVEVEVILRFKFQKDRIERPILPIFAKDIGCKPDAVDVIKTVVLHNLDKSSWITGVNITSVDYSLVFQNQEA